MVSVMHLCLVSIERSLAVCESLTFKMKVTKSSITVYISITWIIPFVYSFGIVFSKANSEVLDMMMLNLCVGSCAFVFNKKWAILCSCTIIFPFTIMSSLYIKIFHVVRKQAKVISSMLVAISSCRKTNHSSEQREKKATKTLGLVMGVCLLCLLPFFIVTIPDPFLDFSTP